MILYNTEFSPSVAFTPDELDQHDGIMTLDPDQYKMFYQIN